MENNKNNVNTTTNPQAEVPASAPTMFKVLLVVRWISLALWVLDALSTPMKAVAMLALGGLVNGCLWGRQAWAHFLATVFAAMGMIGCGFLIFLAMTSDKPLSAPMWASFILISLLEIGSFVILDRRDVRIWCNRKV